MGIVPARGADGKILIGPLPTAGLLDDEDAAPAPAPPPARTPPAPPRRPGDTPTAFDQLRPGPARPADPARTPWPSYAAAALIVALLGLAIWSLRGQAPAAPAAVEAGPTAAATPPGAAVTAAPAWDRLQVALVALDAPGGVALGALEPGRPYLVVGRSGDDWLQLDVGAPGAPNVVWVAAFLAGPPPAVPDLATPTPRPTATPAPYVAPAPAYVPLPDPAYVPPTAPPASTCQAVILDGSEIGQACGTSSAERLATAQALLSTPRGGVPVELATAAPLDVSTFPTAKP